MEINPIQMEKWEKTRQLGKKKFIIKSGVLGWGLPFVIGWPIIMFFITSGERTLFKLISLFFTALIVFPIGGYFSGLTMWNLSEKKYQKYIKNQKNIN